MNSLERRKETFKRFLAYCRQHELSIEFCDVHFCQGSSKNVHTNEKNKERKYRNAFRAFIDREDEEFEDALDHMRFLNKGTVPLGISSRNVLKWSFIKRSMENH